MNGRWEFSYNLKGQHNCRENISRSSEKNMERLTAILDLNRRIRLQQRRRKENLVSISCRITHLFKINILAVIPQKDISCFTIVQTFTIRSFYELWKRCTRLREELYNHIQTLRNLASSNKMKGDHTPIKGLLAQPYKGMLLLQSSPTGIPRMSSSGGQWLACGPPQW